MTFETFDQGPKRPLDGRSPQLCEALARLFANWDFPLGPFMSPDDADREAQEVANELGPDAAANVATCLKRLAREPSAHEGPMRGFAQMYLALWPDFSDALLAELEPDGPVLFVEVLGGSLAPGAARRLIETIDVGLAGSELQLAYFGALGELGDDEAIAALNATDESAFPPEVREEIAIARQNAHR